MPMMRVARHEPISKPEFHRRLKRWLESTNEVMIGPDGVDERTCWVYVRDGSQVFGLHVDTKRDAVAQYLELVRMHGDSLQWEVVESRRQRMTAVAYGPAGLRDTSFYLYLVS